MAAEYQLTLNDYLAILRRRWILIVTSFIILLVIATSVAFLIPSVYESSATILIESQQIRSDMVQGAVVSPAEERIESIKQRVMTRENLLEIIKKYNLFKDQRENLTASELIDELRNSIKIELISVDAGNRRRGGTTIAFKLSFEYGHAFAAYKVTNELATLFLSENVKSRTERAAETTVFLSQEAQRLKSELEKIESQVSAYKLTNAQALPENQEMRMSALQRTENDLRDIEREYKSTQEELRYLDIELEAAKAGVGTANEGVSNMPLPPQSELAKLRAEYDKLSLTYTENHPTLKALKKRIETLEKSSAPAAAAPAASSTPQKQVVPNLLVAKVMAKIESANTRLASLTQQSKELRLKIGQLESQMSQSPKVELGLSTLMRDYQNAKQKYEEVLSKEMTAKLSENLEQENKAEKFTLIEPPQLPDKPTKPDRVKFMLMGLAISIGGAGGLAFAMEMMNQRIFGVNALTVLLRTPPLVTIPYISLPEEENIKKKKFIWLGIAALILLGLALVAIQVFYMPLNVLMFKIAARIG